MNAEALEKLLIDRALGVLSPETEALLAEYLSRDADAAGLAGEIAETARLATETLRSEPRTPPPPLSWREVQRAEGSRRRRQRLRGVAVIAAALLLGTGFGALAFRGPSGSVVPPRSAVVARTPAEPHVPTEAPARSDPSPFWSLAGLRQRAPAARPTRSIGLVWTSPVRKPRLEVRNDTPYRSH